MPNLVEVQYEQTGASKSTNEFGMGDMQEKAIELIISGDIVNYRYDNWIDRIVGR